ncbi:ABC-three component system protein [Clostridium perfringens]
MDGALFVKKMIIENIDNETIKYSKNRFFYSDMYLRKLKIYNTPIEYIDDTFSRCYNIYDELRYREYRKNSNSQMFLEKTMDTLEESNICNESIKFSPEKSQKSGLIHILANDSERDIKWGGKDCE